jgi:exopolyphosphatase / guanosine-5'-triphosphate,3'-diphosphate pyrophosphatase
MKRIDIPSSEGVTVAAFDLGSNAFHLLVARVDRNGRILTQEKVSRYARLGQKTLVDGRIGDEAFSEGLRTLGQLRNLAARHRPDIWRCIATSAVREAENGADFIASVRDEIGINVRIVSEDEESRLIYQAVASGLDNQIDRMVVVDVGGGSTSITLGDSRRATMSSSLRVGALRLRDQWDLGDPPALPMVSLMSDWVRVAVGRVANHFCDAGFSSVVFTSGSALALAKVIGHRLPSVGQVPHYFLPLEKLRAFESDIAAMSIEERLHRDALVEGGRAEHIVEASIITRTIMESLGIDGAMVSTMALRDGLAMDAAQSLHPELVHHAVPESSVTLPTWS